MKNGFFLKPDKLNQGYVVSAAGFVVYLAACALLGQAKAGIVAVIFAVISVYVFLSVAAARKEDKETVGDNLLWGSCSLAIMMCAFIAASIKLWLGL